MRINFNRYKDGKKKALTMSYDDGLRADLRLIEIFNKHGIKGTFHLISEKIGDEKHVSAEEVAAAYVGHEVSAHSLTHPFLTLIPDEQLCCEVLEDRRRLEEMCGYPVCGASYPYGAYSDALVEKLHVLGWRYCRTTKSTGKLSVPNDFLLWNPTCHHEDAHLMEYLEDLRSPRARPLALLYVWGHSYEFDRKNNWEIIERFCEAAGGDPDIWYATNIEIYDYISALRALRFSVDRTLVYNPTATDVWIEADGVSLKVGAGAHLIIVEELKKHESEEQ